MEQLFNEYLQTNIDNKIFVTANLVGIQPWSNSGEAIITQYTLGALEKRRIILKYENDIVTHYVIRDSAVIENCNATMSDIEENLNQRICALENVVKDMLILLTESLPKNPNIPYSSDKTSKLLDFWKKTIIEYPDIISTELKLAFDNLDKENDILSPEEITYKNILQNWIYKLNARHKIEQTLGDIYDLLADGSKRVGMIERLVMRLSKSILNNESLPEEYRTTYTSFVNDYVNAVDNQIFVDRTDLEENSILFPTLMQRFGTITQILQDEYFSKKLT